MNPYRYLVLAAAIALSIPAFGQVRISDGSEPKDPIDAAFDKCEDSWDGRSLSDWNQCIWKARTQWESALNSTYDQLKAKLPPDKRRLLVLSQESWEQAMSADRAFVESHGNLNPYFGAEGAVSYQRSLMLKVRSRTLELREYLEVFASH